jgi:hypothetical protein
MLSLGHFDQSGGPWHLFEIPVLQQLGRYVPYEGVCAPAAATVVTWWHQPSFGIRFEENDLIVFPAMSTGSIAQALLLWVPIFEETDGWSNCRPS